MSTFCSREGSFFLCLSKRRGIFLQKEKNGIWRNCCIRWAFGTFILELVDRDMDLNMFASDTAHVVSMLTHIHVSWEEGAHNTENPCFSSCVRGRRLGKQE